MALGLAKRQHWVVARRQLLALGFTPEAIEHRLKRGRLYQLYRGVYAVGRRDVGRRGTFMAAVLACGEDSVLSHEAAAELWEIWPGRARLEVTVPPTRSCRTPGIEVHRRATTDGRLRHGIPVTSPIRTILDNATRLNEERLERMLNEAMNRDLITPETLRNELEHRKGQPGVRPVQALLDRHLFVATDSVLEQRMAKIARDAGLPQPLTQAHVNGYRVDFFWPDLGIVVEADSLRFHRTPAQQATDRLRDQAHLRAGLIPLRFTHWQVCRDSDEAATTLLAVVAQRA
jgi:very-short-patch-repair endonuclease